MKSQRAFDDTLGFFFSTHTATNPLPLPWCHHHPISSFVAATNYWNTFKASKVVKVVSCINMDKGDVSDVDFINERDD